MAAFLIGLSVGLVFMLRPPWMTQGGERLASFLRKLIQRARLLASKQAGAEPVAQLAPETLAVRLRKLESGFLPLAENAAHPREFSEQPSFQEAVALLCAEDVPLKTVMQYALGTSWSLSCLGLSALSRRQDGSAATDQVLTAFDRLAPWAMSYALSYFLSLQIRPPLGAPFVNAKEWWRDNAVIQIAAQEYCDEAEAFGDLPTFGYALDRVSINSYPFIRGFLERLNGPAVNQLLGELNGRGGAAVDSAFLSSFGRFWKNSNRPEWLIEPDFWHETLEQGLGTVTEQPVRSLLAAGEPRIGKTSFFRLLARRLEREGWTVFEAGGADLMAGQQWFGQLEGRIQKAIEELSTSKKLIWYIPDILQIALSGTHQGQAASILEQILPAITQGRLIVWTETSAAGAIRLLRMRPQLRNVFEMIRFEPLSQDETLAIARSLLDHVRNDDGLSIDPACAEAALASARQYLSSTSLPGSVLDLLKSAVARAKKSETRSLGPQDVLASLSQSTGIPVAILDSNERADLAAIRRYFSSRVMGQDEAVSAIVERIAMLKAGLNDPNKPIGVFLFAGPTGTGKTELAKTLAEFLFGSAERLIRLDMSEYQLHDSTWKILGTADPATQTESLIGRVRKQPFSVVLLDEFEKAHSNVWDLFLQVFDDARLTDSGGHEADFRHCIIILTTNLGATAHQSADLGFLPAAANFSSEQVMRAVSQTFRPEFQNRLDKVLVFHPLDRDLMRSILRKELGRVLERRGFKDREWAVEWEASALEFLLEKGFSPEMGARPLKRAIDQYVIAPLAATIVERRFPEGDQFVFVRSDGKAIQAEFVDPDGQGSDAPTPASSNAEKRVPLPAMIVAASGTPLELQSLENEFEAISRVLSSDAWDERRAAIVEQMHATEFWTRSDRHEVLSRFALIDRVKAAAETAEALRARLAKAPERGGKSSRELIARLALQLHLVGEGAKDVFESAPIETVLSVEPALDRGADREMDPRDWCGRLLDMYRSWAAARNMQLTEIPGARPKEPPILLISGFGAHRALSHEIGLHVLEKPDAEKAIDRVTARVRLAPAPLGDIPPSRLRQTLFAALACCDAPNVLVRRYRNGASPLVRDMVAGWRTGRLEAVLRGDFDLIGAAQM